MRISTISDAQEDPVQPPAATIAARSRPSTTLMTLHVLTQGPSLRNAYPCSTLPSLPSEADPTLLIMYFILDTPISSSPFPLLARRRANSLLVSDCSLLLQFDRSQLTNRFKCSMNTCKLTSSVNIACPAPGPAP